MRYRYLRFPEGRAKAVTLSYDDGVIQDVRFAETIGKYGMKCTFNINSALFGTPTRLGGRLTAEDIKKHLVDKGHEIAVHGDRHIASAAASPVVCMRDALDCRLKLEETFGMIIRGMAYPDSGIRVPANGNSYETVKQILSSIGIVYSRTLGGDNNSFALPTDWHAWMPTAHHRNQELFRYINEFVSLDFESIGMAASYPRLFYLWGHTYEFERDNNWDLLDKICECLGGREDIWYATNMEIYEYVKAYDSLVFSADDRMVYNPTLKTVWFALDKQVFKVESGETIKI